MCDFLYNLIKKSFDAELLFTDTDSLTYEIKLENVYEKFFKWKEFQQKIQSLLMRLIKKLQAK